MKPASPIDIAAIRARAAAPMHFDAISARSEIPWLRETVARLADEVERLCDALRPFARVAEHDIGDDETDGDTFLPFVDRRHARAPLLTVGELRRALAALKEIGNG